MHELMDGITRGKELHMRLFFIHLFWFLKLHEVDAIFIYLTKQVFKGFSKNDMDIFYCIQFFQLVENVEELYVVDVCLFTRHRG